MRFTIRGRFTFAAVVLIASVFVPFGLRTGVAAASEAAVPANVSLRQLSSDPFASDGNSHQTQVEPDSFAFGSSIVAAFQSGRSIHGGSSGIGWATSTDGGRTWRHGFLSGITKDAGAGPYDRVSDPSVAYDALHATWLISSLAVIQDPTNPTDPTKTVGAAVLVSRSTNGGTTWSGPTTVASVDPTTGESLDKNWSVCDNTPASPHYGHCYTEYDNAAAGNGAFHMSTSNDGGVIWNAAMVPVESVLGGQPVVQPNGTVIVPIQSNRYELVGPPIIESFISTNGGATFLPPYKIADLKINGKGTFHEVNGDLRAGKLPSAEIDAAGNVYVVWADCRFRTACASNDLVMSTSTDGMHWLGPTRIPIDPIMSTIDHFIPGLGVDNTTSGAHAHLALTYYYYSNTSCPGSCDLNVGFVSSTDGGAHWTDALRLAGPMKLPWLPASRTDDKKLPVGRMVGDYISTSFINHVAYPVFAVAHPPHDGTFDEAIYTINAPLSEHATFNCTIRSHANGKYVSADPAINRMLRANAVRIGGSQRYQCIALGKDQWAIKSYGNARFVRVESGAPGTRQDALRAIATVGRSATYTFTDVSTCSCFAIKATNSKFVTAELGYKGSTYGLLRARAGSVGPRELFDIAPG